MEPLVSVCMPVYNGERFLRKAIESVLSQSLEDFELIICDDCSADASVAIIRSFEDCRIRFFENSGNLGLVGNWNEAVSHATGRYVKLMMQDDILGRDALLRQSDLLEKNPQASMSVGNTSVIDVNDRVIFERHRFPEDVVEDGKKFARKSLRGRNIFCEPPNHMFRRDLIDKLGLYDKSLIYTPDWDMCIRMCEAGDVACTSEEVMRFRISDTQETSRIYHGKVGNANRDSDRMFIKHMNSGILKLGRFDFFRFRFVIRAAAVARSAVLAFKR